MINSQYTEDNLDGYFNAYDEDASTITQNALIKNDLVGIFGMPYQFLGSVDPRIPSASNSNGSVAYNSAIYGSMSNTSPGIGAMYAEKIVARAPLLFLIPCKQMYMSDFSKEDKQTALSALLSGNVGGDLNTLLKHSGRYYSVDFDYARYYNHVNMMCAELAVLMEVADKQAPNGTKLKNIDWGDQKNAAFGSYFNGGKGTVFYVDGADSLSESFSNSSTESSLASMINEYSYQAKEIRFLLGRDSALGAMVQDTSSMFENAAGSVSGVVDNLFGGMLGDIANNGVSTIINGGKLLFPKIWQDSSFDRSYSFEIKLRSPDHDNVSIFLNIMVPFLHLLAMVLPEGMDSGDIVDPNGYTTPFLCKAYMKGMFNIDMGLITGLSVTRGATAQWNDSGLPTQMDISIQIEDLYSGLSLTARAGDSDPLKAPEKLASVVTNTAMLDYLSNLAGLNLGDPELARKAKLFNSLTMGELGRTAAGTWRNVDQGLNNLIANLYKRL